MVEEVEMVKMLEVVETVGMMVEEEAQWRYVHQEKSKRT
jgi:hypothetical protein